MRITGGVWTSRRLKGPGRGLAIRPTPDALRERAFAVLGDAVGGARLLDLFAGTGAVSLEALSRGAASAVLVESHRQAAALIRHNLASLEVPAGRARLLVRPAVAAVRSLARAGERFDLAWTDPPFEAWEGGLEALEMAVRLGVLPPGATACLECPAEAEVGVEPDRLALCRDLGGGASRLVIFEVLPPARRREEKDRNAKPKRRGGAE